MHTHIYTYALTHVHQVSDVACGLYHCLALTTVGRLWSFGLNNRGQLGTCKGPIRVTESLDLTCEPTPIMNFEAFNSVPKPVMIDFLDITDYTGNIIGQPFVTKIAAGAFHSVAIASPCITSLEKYRDPCPQYDFTESDLYSWGNNRYGQLGVGLASDFTFKQTPTLVMSLQTSMARCRETEFAVDTGCVPPQDYFRMGRKVTNVAAGSWHTLLFVVQKERIGYRRSFVEVNRLYSMGNNEEGQLGHGDTVSRNKATQVPTNYVRLHHVAASFFQSIYTQGCLPHDGNVCMGNGLCYEQGVCKCYPGYRGVDCSIECDGGAKTVCSGHGNDTLAFSIARWRQDVIRAAIGKRLVTRLRNLFTSYFCVIDPTSPSAVNISKKANPNVLYTSAAQCKADCGITCKDMERRNVTSGDVVNFLDSIVHDFPAMSTAVRLVKEDWPLALFNQVRVACFCVCACVCACVCVCERERERERGRERGRERFVSQ